jgi:hypothetical protein
MRMHTIFVLVVCGGLGIASPAAAQARIPAEDRGAAPANLTFGPITNSPVVQFLFETNKDTKIGTAAFGWKTGQEQFQLSVSGPLTEGSSEPLNLDGLPPGATARLNWNHLYKRGPSRAERREIIEMCRPIQQAKRDAALREWEFDGTKPKPPDDLRRYSCISDDFTDLEKRADFEAAQRLYDPALLFGADVSVARTKFKYLDATTMDASEEHLGGNVTLRAGIVAPAFVSVYVSYKWVDAHKPAGDPAQICSPIDGTSSTRCRQAVLGAPTPVERSILSLELRRFFGPHIATSPSIQHDFKNDGVTEVAVPIYFIGSGTNATGGVRFNWRSDKREVTAVVFVGATIGLLPG